MILQPGRSHEQRELVADLYRRAVGLPRERTAVIAAGLRGADIPGALACAGVDQSRHLTISIDLILAEMAARGLIPPVAGLSPLEAADLVHAEAQYLAKRTGLLALADGRNLIWDITMASPHTADAWLKALRSAGYTVTAVFADISIDEAVRRSAASHRRGTEEYLQGWGHGGRYIPPEAIRALAATQATDRPDRVERAVPAAVTSDAAFPSGPVTEMIASYRAGHLSLDDLILEFRARRWPIVPSACPPGLEHARPAIDDPEPYIPGSVDDIDLAYDLGQLTDTEHQTLTALATLT